MVMNGVLNKCEVHLIWNWLVFLKFKKQLLIYMKTIFRRLEKIRDYNQINEVKSFRRFLHSKNLKKPKQN